MDSLLERLCDHFQTNDLGEATYYLGIEIERGEDGSYLLHQESKIKQMLE